MDHHISAVASAAEIAATDQSGRQFTLMAQDSELADIIYRGNRGNELNPLERVRYDGYWFACFVYCQNAFLQNKRGYTGKPSWQLFDVGFSQYMSFVGVDTLWRQQQTQECFDPDFVAHINNKLSLDSSSISDFLSKQDERPSQ